MLLHRPARRHRAAVAELAGRLALRLGLEPDEAESIRVAGSLHDLGELVVPEEILRKPARLTESERHAIERHSQIGSRMLELLGMRSIPRWVLHHHERWDGTGYPDRLKGEDIPLLARIVACADTFDACTSTRPYQKAMPLEKAMEILDNLSGAQLDPKVVLALRQVLAKQGVRLEGHRLPVKLAS